jgi:hypothetical protein
MRGSKWEGSSPENTPPPPEFVEYKKLREQTN